MLMMCDAVERWQKIAVISFSSVSILLFLLNRVIWESDGSGDISSVGFLFVLYMALIITSAQTTILLSHFLRRTKVKLNYLYLRIKNIYRISIAGGNHV